MTRRRLALTIVVLVALAAGVAAAISAWEFRVRGDSDTLTPVAWDTTRGTLTNDTSADASPDPTSGGLVAAEGLTRGPLNVGYMNSAFAGGDLVLTAREVYANYRSTTRAYAQVPARGDLVVQRVIVTDLGGAGYTPFVPGTDLIGRMRPGDCGRGLGTDQELRFDIHWQTAGKFNFTANIEMVPTANYIAANCVAY